MGNLSFVSTSDSRNQITATSRDQFNHLPTETLPGFQHLKKNTSKLMKIVLRTLCSDTKTQEKPATWKNKKFHAHNKKKNIFKRSENAIIGGTTEPTSPSLGIKSSTQTGLVFVFNHLPTETLSGFQHLKKN